MSLGAVISIKIGLRGMTAGARTVKRNIAFFMSGNRFDLLMIFIFEIRDEKLPVPIALMKLDVGELIGFEFLIFRGMGIIKGPLFERDIFADKVNKPAVLLVEKLNE